MFVVMLVDISMAVSELFLRRFCSLLSAPPLLGWKLRLKHPPGKQRVSERNAAL